MLLDQLIIDIVIVTIMYKLYTSKISDEYRSTCPI